jgi:hypothetical protein
MRKRFAAFFTILFLLATLLTASYLESASTYHFTATTTVVARSLADTPGGSCSELCGD